MRLRPAQADTARMTEPTPTADSVPPVGPDRAPEFEDTSARPEDGPQPEDQEPNYDLAESDDNQEDDDPEVHEVA
jgi:hypothetical protein